MTFRSPRRRSREAVEVPYHDHQAEDISGGVFSRINVGGDVFSSNWNGAIPADLGAGVDPLATQGWYLDASAGVIQALSFLGGVVPAGTVVETIRSTAPAGWLLMDGTEYLRADYQDLWDIGGSGGSGFLGNGNGTTTFTVPDMSRMVPVGKAAAGDASVLGDTGGAWDHDHDQTVHNHAQTVHGHNAGTLAADHGHANDIAFSNHAAHEHYVYDYVPISTDGHGSALVQSGTNVNRLTGPTGSHTGGGYVDVWTSGGPGALSHTKSGGVTAATVAVTGATADSAPVNTGDSAAVKTGVNNQQYRVFNFMVKT